MGKHWVGIDHATLERGRIDAHLVKAAAALGELPDDGALALAILETTLALSKLVRLDGDDRGKERVLEYLRGVREGAG